MNRPKLLASSLAFHPKRGASLPPKEQLRWALGAGFAGMEFLCEPPWHPAGWSGEERNVRAEALRHGLFLSLHAPVADVNLMSPHPAARALAEAELRAAVELAAAIGADSLTFHLGYRPPMGAPHVPPWEEARAAILRLRERARQSGVALCLENDPRLPLTYLWDLGQFRQVLTQWEIPGTLDLGHAWTAHGAEAICYLPDLVPLLHCVHLHDNCGEHDEHLALGEGVVDIARAWPILAQVPTAVIEAKTEAGLRQSLAVLKNLAPG